MSWINQHQRNWRIALLVLMVVAFMGPWAFDRVNVPSEYECSAPYIRLVGDFCGVPASGFRVCGGIISISVGLVTGEFVLFEMDREILISLLLLSPFLPVFSTLFLILRGDHQRGQVFTIIAWVLAICGSLFLGLNLYPIVSWAVWGLWLYIGLAASALILEIIVLVRKKDSEQRKSEM